MARSCSVPKYNYKCKKCQKESVVFTVKIDQRKKVKCEECDIYMQKTIGKPKKTIVKTRSKITGKAIKENLTEELKQRSHQHFMEHEMEELIAKYGTETAENLGWIDKKTGKRKTLLDEK